MMTVIRVELTVQIEYAVFLSKRLVKKKTNNNKMEGIQ